MATAKTTSDVLPSVVDMSPLVHFVHCPSTRTWQYIVADPTTHHCAILDPVRDHCADPAMVSYTAADSIIELVKENKYIVDYILETHTAGSNRLSAAWYLRMQFSQYQGWPPQVCNEATVSSLQTMWQRKYGATQSFPTTIKPGLEDGEALKLGALALTCMHLPGFEAFDRRAYLVGSNMFGAHDIATLKAQASVHNIHSRESATHASDADSGTSLDAWTSLQRIMSLPGETRIWYESGHDDGAHEFEPYDLLCAAAKKLSGTSKSAFLAHRRVESACVKPPSQRAGGLMSRLGKWLSG